MVSYIYNAFGSHQGQNQVKTIVSKLVQPQEDGIIITYYSRTHGVEWGQSLC